VDILIHIGQMRCQPGHDLPAKQVMASYLLGGQGCDLLTKQVMVCLAVWL
jgi:hypothetical protein